MIINWKRKIKSCLTVPGNKFHTVNENMPITKIGPGMGSGHTWYDIFLSLINGSATVEADETVDWVG